MFEESEDCSTLAGVQRNWRQYLHNLPDQFRAYLENEAPENWTIQDFVRSLQFTDDQERSARKAADRLLQYLLESNLQVLKDRYKPLRKEVKDLSQQEWKCLLVDPNATTIQRQTELEVQRQELLKILQQNMVIQHETSLISKMSQLGDVIVTSVIQDVKSKHELSLSIDNDEVHANKRQRVQGVKDKVHLQSYVLRGGLNLTETLKKYHATETVSLTEYGLQSVFSILILAAFSWILDLQNLGPFDEQLSCKDVEELSMHFDGQWKLEPFNENERKIQELISKVDVSKAMNLCSPLIIGPYTDEKTGNVEMPMETSLLWKLLFAFANEWETIPNPLMDPELSEGDFTKIAVAPPVRILSRIVSKVVKLIMSESITKSSLERKDTEDRRLAHKLDFSWISMATDHKDIGGGEVAGPPWQQTMEKKRMTRVKSLRQNKDNSRLGVAPVRVRGVHEDCSQNDDNIVHCRGPPVRLRGPDDDWRRGLGGQNSFNSNHPNDIQRSLVRLAAVSVFKDFHG
ncbi:hypothetical protein BC936DRAFT_146511, partial [Jimgerdemannia flammicorona]